MARDLVLNMAGFEHVVPNALEVAVDDGPTLPVVPLPLYAVLKLVAFSDRKAAKDLAGVYHCLRFYLDGDERRYGAEHDGVGVPFEYTGAWLLGTDGQPFVSVQVERAVGPVLDTFMDPYAEPVGMVIRESGRLAPDDGTRTEVFELFRWYRRGIGL